MNETTLRPKLGPLISPTADYEQWFKRQFRTQPSGYYANVANFSFPTKRRVPWYDDPEPTMQDLWERIYRPRLELLRLELVKA